MSASCRPLVLAASRTGNTMILAHAVADALGAELRRADDAPEDFSAYGPVILGFWNDKGKPCDPIPEIAARLAGKDIGLFWTQGSDPDTEDSRARERRWAGELGTAGNVKAVFCCRGAIAQDVFDFMTKMLGGTVSPQRARSRQEASTHPDRLDVLRAVDVFTKAFGSR